MGSCMYMPETFDEFIKDYSFKDKKEEYTNGAQLIPVFRVMQGVEHYFAHSEHGTNKTGWVDVNERLPKNPIDKRGYLCMIKAANLDHPIYMVLNFFDFLIPKKFQGEDEYGEIKVTHWMPIPEPPKENNENE